MKKQNGFTLVEGLFIVVVVGLIGFGGFYVWTQNSNNKSEQKEVEQQENSIQQNNEQKSDNLGYDLSKTYTNSNFKIEFSYPSTWAQVESENNPDWIYFESADFVAPTSDGLGPTAEAGYLLEVRVSEQEEWESYNNDLENAPLAQENHGGFYEAIKIDGSDAILSSTKTSGTFLYATTYKNGMKYYFVLNAPDENKPEVKDLFKAILATAKLN